MSTYLDNRGLVAAYAMVDYGSIALLSHLHKVLALSKFTLLMCENEVNSITWIP